MTDITILPFDLTGKLSSNLRTGEEHTLTKVAGKTNRMFCPKFGAYYADSLTVRTSTGVPLVRGTDFDTTYYYKDIWDLNAKSACAIIVVTNPDIPNDLRISYQALGGPYALSVEEIAAVLEEVDNNPEKIPFDDILGKPLQWWPEPHEHEYWQLYGLESTIINLEILGENWATGRKGLLNDNRYYYRNFIDLAEKAVDDYTVKVLAHIDDRNNPHQSDKAKIGLGQINNWGMANETESRSITITNKYQPVGGVFNQLIANVTPLLNNHIANRNNPHRVRLDHPLLNLYSRVEIEEMLDKRLARTEVAIDSKAFAGLSAEQVYSQLRSNLDASMVLNSTRFVQNQFAPQLSPWDPANSTLLGNQTFELYANLMKAFNDSRGSIQFIGGEPIANYLSVPDGTFILTGGTRTLVDIGVMNLLAYRRDRSATNGFVQLI